MAAVTACSFASGAPNRKLRKAFRMDLLDPNSWALAYANKFFVDVRHLMSLLHGVACMELREDDDLDNLIAFDAANPACSPPLCFTNLSTKDKTDIQRAQANRPNRINFRSFYGLERHQRYCAVLKLSIPRRRRASSRASSSKRRHQSNRRPNSQPKLGARYRAKPAASYQGAVFQSERR